jgi:hypothetical protein
MAVLSGPQIASDSLYTYHVATSSGTFLPNFTGTVEVLVVAGGGGGGMDMGGGGGGGGVVSNTTYSVTSGSGITVTVGAGGIGAPAGGTVGQGFFHAFQISATAGGNSVFGSITAVGGGYGSSSYWGYSPNSGYAGSGGSGGGASGYTDGNSGRGGSGTAGQGNAGAGSIGQYYPGGGGGAGGAGSSNPGTGGAGILSDILGYPLYWGGGGGGSGYSSYGGNGGIGGGGGGAVYTASDVVASGGVGLNNGQPGGGQYPGDQVNVKGGDGGASTGGGGGGGSHYNRNNGGGNGGSGIVIIRHLKSSGTSTFNGNGSQNRSTALFSLDAANQGKGGSVEVLIVAGGGGGGMDMGGGGGGGPAYKSANYPIEINTPLTIVVGAGGAGSPGTYASNPATGSIGANSSIGSTVMLGGGGGGSGHYFGVYGTFASGTDGGTGGGDAAKWGRGRGSSYEPGVGSIGKQGGGGGVSSGYGDGGYFAGGGGGASGSAGMSGNYYKAGNGGAGIYSDINGTGYYWGGGGGGAAHTGTAGPGGSGGGGGGSAYSGGTAASGGSGLNSGASGTAAVSVAGGNGGTNTGGGGGGGSHYASVGGNGGSGIVIIRYKGSQKATGGTITSSGGYTIHTFTSSGTFTPTEWIGARDISHVNTPVSLIGTTYSTSNGGSYVFNGSSDYIDLGGDRVFKTTGGHTVENWFKLDAVVSGNLYNFIGASEYTYHSWFWSVYQSKLAVWDRILGGWYYGGTTIQPGVWYQAVMVTSNSGTSIQFYLNGVNDGGTVSTNTFDASGSGLKIGYIGRGNAAEARYFYGSMPVTRVFNKALTADEVRQNFNTLRGRFGI